MLAIHVRVKNSDGSAKFEVNPLRLIENNGMKSKDIYLAESVIEENTEVIIKSWKEYFGNGNK